MQASENVSNEDSFFKKFYDSRDDENTLASLITEFQKYINESDLKVNVSASDKTDFKVLNTDTDKEDLYIIETLKQLLIKADETFINKFLIFLNSSDNDIEDSLVPEFSQTLARLSLSQESLDQYNRDHLILKILKQDVVSDKELVLFNCTPLYSFDTIKSLSLSHFEQPNINYQFEFHEVLFTAFISSAKLLNQKPDEIQQLYESLTILPIDITYARVKDSILEYSANKQNVLTALNIISSTSEPIYFIINNSRHWAAVALVPLDDGEINIYQFDSMVRSKKSQEIEDNDEGKEMENDQRVHENLTNEFVDQLKDFLPNIQGTNSDPSFHVNKVTDLSIYVQQGNNCGLAAGLFIGCLNSIFAKKSEEFSLENFNELYTKKCLPKNSTPEDYKAILNNLYDYVCMLNRLDLNLYRLQNTISFARTKYDLIKEMDDTIFILQKARLNTLHSGSLKEQDSLSSDETANSIHFVANTSLSNPSTDTNLLMASIINIYIFIACIFTNSLFEESKKVFLRRANDFSLFDSVKHDHKNYTLITSPSKAASTFGGKI